MIVSCNSDVDTRLKFKEREIIENKFIRVGGLTTLPNVCLFFSQLVTIEIVSSTNTDFLQSEWELILTGIEFESILNRAGIL